MARIFISYKRKDKDKVFKIKEHIESALGEKCWIDLDGIESDAQFKNVIINAINDCEVLLFMYSQCHAMIVDYERDWTVRELNFAQKKDKRIVFVNIDKSPLTDAFEFDYGTKQQVDGTSEEAVIKLIKDLSIWLDISLVKEKIEVGQLNSSEKKETSREYSLVDLKYSDSSRMAKSFFLFDVIFVCLWAYFFSHVIWIEVLGTSSFTFVFNYLPILLRVIVSIQLYRNEKYSYKAFILFIITYFPYLVIGYGIKPFASIIIRPFEYLNIFSKGVLFDSVNRLDSFDKQIIGILVCLLFFIIPSITYLVKWKRKKLHNTIQGKGVLSIFTDYIKGDPLLWYILTVILSVSLSFSIQKTYVFPKSLFFIMVNIVMYSMTFRLQGQPINGFKKSLIVLFISSFLLMDFPFAVPVGTIFMSYFIYKGTKKITASLLFYIICGIIVPFILFNELLVNFFIK